MYDIQLDGNFVSKHASLLLPARHLMNCLIPRPLTDNIAIENDYSAKMSSNTTLPRLAQRDDNSTYVSTP